MCVEKVFWMSNDFAFSEQRGAISNHRFRLLSTLGLDDATLLSLASSFGNDYHGAVSSLEALAAYACKRWIASKNQLRLH